MVLEFFKGGADQPLEEIEEMIVQMLFDNRHTFDLAINTVVGGTEATSVGNEVRKSDRRVNKAERRVRRHLVVHASVRGDHMDLARVLVGMSVIKDAERIGDQSKNIWDLGSQGIDFTGDDDITMWLGRRDRTSTLIAETARIYRERDTAAAHTLNPELDAILDEYDALVEEQIASSLAPRHAVPRALISRYLKRITAHLMNVLTSLVMPVDRLDYYDEDKADRD